MKELTKKFKTNLLSFIENNQTSNGFYIDRQLYFWVKIRKAKQKILRIWKKGFCRFSNLR